MISASQIKARALELGFSLCGICDASDLESERTRYEEWLRRGFAGDMNYLHNHLNLRFSPSQLHLHTQSIVVVAHNYYTQTAQSSPNYRIAKYALGEDYHRVVKDHLNELLDYIKTFVPNVDGRAFVDSAPVLERRLAVKAGLGWIGKNNLLITPQYGSFVFLASLFINIPLDYDRPFEVDRCGTCERCLEQCPSQALLAPQLMDARKCISYLTIEKRSALQVEEQGQVKGHLYGCDICQDVCPWNHKLAQEHREPRYLAKPSLLSFGDQDWERITEQEYQLMFKNSAVKRIKYAGLLRNIRHDSL